MSSITIAAISFACISGGVLLGIQVRALLPDHHFKDEAMDTVKMGAGLIATLAAMVLGLLVSSAKGGSRKNCADYRRTAPPNACCRRKHCK